MFYRSHPTDAPFSRRTFDGRLEGAGHSDHDVGGEDPEDVVDEEAAQQNAAGQHVVEVQHLHTVH